MRCRHVAGQNAKLALEGNPLEASTGLIGEQQPVQIQSTSRCHRQVCNTQLTQPLNAYAAMLLLTAQAWLNGGRVRADQVVRVARL